MFPDELKVEISNRYEWAAPFANRGVY